MLLDEKEDGIVLMKVNPVVQGQHPTQVKERRNVKSKYYGQKESRTSKRVPIRT